MLISPDEGPDNPRKGVSLSAVKRLHTLDGMRGLAAMAVLIHHYIARWAPPVHTETLYPHGDLQNYLPFTAYFGKFGVLLFFLISGFVIFMTLERSSGILYFWVRRIARLWPAMLFCATLSAILTNFSGIADYYGMGFWHVTWAEYFASIFFILPQLVYDFLNLPGEAHWVEGAYWTLWHEIRFYAIISVVFWLSPKQWFLWAWLMVQTLSTTLAFIREVDPTLGFSFYWVGLVVQPYYLCWFSLGIVGYLYWENRASLPAVLLGFVALISVALHHLLDFKNGGFVLSADFMNTLFMLIAIAGFFVLFLMRNPLLSFLSARPFLALGAASYPLYLFHELPGMVVFMIGETLGFPGWVGLVIAPVLMVLMALLVHRFVEIPAKFWIVGSTKPMVTSFEQKFTALRFRKEIAQFR